MRPAPNFALRLLRWFCKPWYAETIEGDLLELYDRQVLTSPRLAPWAMWWNVLGFVRWRYLKNAEDFFPKSSIGMFKNYFKISLRNMRRHKVQTFLNLFGMAVGIGCCLLMLMHVRHQLSYDQHLPKLDQTYRVALNGQGPYTPARLVSEMRREYPEVVTGTRVSGPMDGMIEVDRKYLVQPGGLMADSTFFEVFPAEFLSGEARHALNRPNTVVLTQSMAATLFPEREAVGEVIRSTMGDYTVTAVVKDPPSTTTVPYRYIVSIPWEFWATTGWWTGNNFFSYVQLQPGASPEELEAKLVSFVERHIGPEILSFNTNFNSFEEYLAGGNSHFFKLIPLRNVHLHHPRFTLNLPGSAQNLLVFSLVAAFILLIACINYVNMSTARASLRAKEIGLRKVMGSAQAMIARQFYAEAFLTTGLALLLGMGLATVCLSFFNQVSQQHYTIRELLTPEILGWSAVLVVVATLLSGSYPAAYLSSFSPVAALRGEVNRGGSGRIRMGLVVLQFAISLFLLAATFIVYQQVDLMTHRRLGMDADQVFVIRDGRRVTEKYPAFKARLLESSHISTVAVSSGYPSGFLADWNYRTVGDDPVSINPINFFASSELAEAWGLQLLQGRFFEADRATDTAAVVVNAHLVKTLGWQDPIGQILSRGGNEQYRVIGVVDDFVLGSARRGQWPLLFRYHHPQHIGINEGGAYVMVKVSGDVQQALSHIEQVWDEFQPGYPMNGTFLDDSFSRLYEGERRFGLLFSGFSVVAIFIACIGLFALASFTLERKRKEIALRKVMGAGVPQILLGVGRYFARLLVVGAVVALPAVFYLGNNWLEGFVDRIHIGAMVLVLPLLLLTVVAMATIFWQVYRAALSNPVEALKEE